MNKQPGGAGIPSTVKVDNDPQRIDVGQSLPQHNDMSSGVKDWDKDGDPQPRESAPRVDAGSKQKLNP
jgi:hypothetical protein